MLLDSNNGCLWEKPGWLKKRCTHANSAGVIYVGKIERLYRTMNVCDQLRSLAGALTISALLGVLMPNSVWALGWFGNDLNGVTCDGRGQAFGPYDYFDVNEESDPLYMQGRYWEIDKVHTDNALPVLAKKGPISFGDLRIAASELDYTLRAIPNDPRALRLMLSYDRLRRANPGLTSTIPRPECYFQRAYEFRSNQEHIPLIHGIYLHQIERYKLAIMQFKKAISINEKATEAHYNLALALIADGRAEKAVSYAEKAYSLGFPLPGLRNRLIRLGLWNKDASK